MEEERGRIAAACPRFACRVCRTKTGWPHQPWCPLSRAVEPDCGGCRYWEPKEGECIHPALRREGAQNEEDQRPV